MRKIILLIGLFLWIMPVYANEKVNVTFSKCVDGDTAKFILNDEEITARFLAIDTPETVDPSKPVQAFGKEASNYTCDKLTNAKKIELEYDDSSDKMDKYDRHLVWVYYDDNFLQEELIKLGYAKVAYLYGDYSYTSSLQNMEIQAKNDKVGMWSDNSNINTLKEYTVTFSYDGKTKKVKVNEGDKVTPITSPSKDGYKFIGWYIDNQEYDFSTIVTNDLKLEAKFEKQTIPVYVYVIMISIVIIMLITNYKGKRTKLKRKIKSTIKKDLKKKIMNN